MEAILIWIRDYLIVRYIADPILNWMERRTRTVRQWWLLLVLFHTRMLGRPQYRSRVELVFFLCLLPHLLKGLKPVLAGNGRTTVAA
ncbi:MAG: hypothetical protein JSS84_03195 [Bacteroidetes bacterium]|nr:hypothetical protein [Bacteroidota bacterium]